MQKKSKNNIAYIISISSGGWWWWWWEQDASMAHNKTKKTNKKQTKPRANHNRSDDSSVSKWGGGGASAQSHPFIFAFLCGYVLLKIKTCTFRNAFVGTVSWCCIGHWQMEARWHDKCESNVFFGWVGERRNLAAGNDSHHKENDGYTERNRN